MRHSSYFFAVVLLAACNDATPNMHVERATVFTGEDVVVVIDGRLEGRATNQYWVALLPAAAAPDDTTGRTILERSDHVVRLHTSAPGDFEVRLHGQYPKEDHHLLARIPVKVEGWPAKTATRAPRSE